MVFALLKNVFRPDPRRPLIDALYTRVATAARAMPLYETFGVPDTPEGRFEALTLHAVLLLRRLRQLPPPADAMGQEFVDTTFAQLDAALRELGVGDLSVGKRMKKLAKAFYGRATTYDAALDANDDAALARALARNILGDEGRDASAFAAYAIRADRHLAALDLDAITGAADLFPAPVLGEAR
jgi:cytochrome b pre-mRNA-processing protein 3